MLAASPFCLERRGLVLKIHCPHLPRPVILVRDWDPSQWGSPELHRWSLQFGGNNMSWKQRRSRVTELRTVFISDSFPLTLNRFWTASGNSRKAAWKLKLQTVRSLKVWSFSAQLERRGWKFIAPCDEILWGELGMAPRQKLCWPSGVNENIEDGLLSMPSVNLHVRPFGLRTLRGLAFQKVQKETAHATFVGVRNIMRPPRDKQWWSDLNLLNE